MSQPQKDAWWEDGVENYGENNEIDAKNVEEFYTFCLGVSVCFGIVIKVKKKLLFVFVLFER